MQLFMDTYCTNYAAGTMLKFILLLTVIWTVSAAIPSVVERDELLANFTKLREDVQPEASNMNLLRYSEKMQKVASAWVSLCIPAYPSADSYPDFAKYGFIFSFYSGEPDFSDALFVTKNRTSYNYDTDTCIRSCRYYKQAVWASSTRVGCAKKYCPEHHLGLVACAFDRANNRQVGRPYKEGQSCSKCPKSYSCVRKQCTREPRPQPGNGEPTSDSATSSFTTTYASSSSPLTSITTQKNIHAVSTTTPEDGNGDYITEGPFQEDIIMAPSSDIIHPGSDLSPGDSLKAPAKSQNIDKVSSTPQNHIASLVTESFAGLRSVSTTSDSSLLLAFASLHFAMLMVLCSF
uniref:SCP domain-containing protein n=2 Tax=Mesocestoides corti TaxID=53468 RepID=A0A5K3F0T8_MESCO